MRFTLFNRLGLTRGWSRELAAAVAALALGFGLMPLLIFYAGSGVLGRYDSASASRLYGSVYRGLQTGSVASWLVVLGPYGLYLVFKGLHLWWYSSTPTDHSSFDEGGR